MHQTRKGNQWYFGMKAHIGVDSKHGHVHSVCSSAASVADKHTLPDLLHGKERKVWDDGGYQGQGEAIRKAAPQAQDRTSRRTRYKRVVDELQRRKEPDQGQGAGQDGTSFPHFEARVRIRESTLPRPAEESPSPVRRICAGEPLHAPQTAGPSGGVVCPETAKNALSGPNRKPTSPFVRMQVETGSEPFANRQTTGLLRGSLMVVATKLNVEFKEPTAFIGGICAGQNP